MPVPERGGVRGRGQAQSPAEVPVQMALVVEARPDRGLGRRDPGFQQPPGPVHPLSDLKRVRRRPEPLPESLDQPVLAQAGRRCQVRERHVGRGAVRYQRQCPPHGRGLGPARPGLPSWGRRRPPRRLAPPGRERTLPLQQRRRGGEQSVQGDEPPGQAPISEHGLPEHRWRLPPEIGIADQGRHVGEFHDEQQAPPRSARHWRSPVRQERVQHRQAARAQHVAGAAALQPHGAAADHADHVLAAGLGRVRGHDAVHRDDPRQSVRPPGMHHLRLGAPRSSSAHDRS